MEAVRRNDGQLRVPSRNPRGCIRMIFFAAAWTVVHAIKVCNTTRNVRAARTTNMWMPMRSAFRALRTVWDQGSKSKRETETQRKTVSTCLGSSRRLPSRREIPVASHQWVSFTYEDHVLAQFPSATPDHDINQHNIGVSGPRIPVRVAPDNPRNLDGEYFTVLVTRTVRNPRPGSDEISRVCEEGWIGTNGYVRPDGS